MPANAINSSKFELIFIGLTATEEVENAKTCNPGLPVSLPAVSFGFSL
jgi:hypothetical protein